MGAVFVLIVAILGFGWWREYVARPTDPVATVAGQTITLDSYARMLDFQRKSIEQQLLYLQFQLQSLGNDQADQSTAALVRQQIQQLQFNEFLLPDQTLENLIDQQLVRQEAARRGITVSADEIDNEIKQQAAAQSVTALEATPTPAPSDDQQAASSGAAAAPVQATATPLPTTNPAQAGPTPAATSGQANSTPAPTPTVDVKSWENQYLSLTGLTEAEFRSMVADQLLYQKLSDAMGAEVPAFVEQIHVRHIVVDSEDKAKQIEDQLKNGASFEDLAKANSTDTATKDKGGDLGWLPQGKMDPQFDTAAFKLEVNQISDPVQTYSGYEIIQVLEKDPNRPLAPSDLEQRKADAIVQWLNGASAAPDVKRYLSDGDKAWVYKRIGWTPPALGE
jgi:parvulin-like peptidyl-prolyl isomerase